MSEAVGPEEDSVGVSTLELFFDLVFVFIITQLTSLLTANPSPRGLLQMVLIMGVTWWMYGGYAWLTNAVPATTTARRLLLITSMAGFLVMALAIPSAFGSHNVAFGLGYLLVNVMHMALFTRTSTASAVRAILRIGRFNIASAVLVLVACVLGGWPEYVLWSAAFVLQVCTPYLTGGVSGFVVRAGHFVERHGLVVIIAFGESVVAIGIGAAESPVDGALVGVAVLGLALTACLWWAYFGGDDDEVAERSLAATPAQRRGRRALWAYGYAHVVLLLGVVVLAAGVKKAVGHAFGHAATYTAWYLAGGVATYLIGDTAFRRVLGIGPNRVRLVAAALALATVPLGLYTAVVVQLGALVAVLAGALVAERATRRAWGPRPSPTRG